MKLDLDPEKNREQYEKLRSFSANNMLVLRKGFWIFAGSICILASVLVYFEVPTSISGGTKEEVSLSLLATGIGIMAATILISFAWSKLAEYTPRANEGDEWQK